METPDSAKALGLEFNNPKLLDIALTHRSYINEVKGQKLEHNERLEFLGDAVLQLVVTEYLYKNYPDPEGVLTNWRSALVKTQALSRAAQELGINEMVRLSRGEAKGSQRAKLQIWANTVEAVIGAIYMDKGYVAAQEFIAKNIIKWLPEIIKTGAWQDAKTKYQEIIQDKDGVTPIYEVLEEAGPDHDKRFTVGVYVGEKLTGKGSGSSKQVAQQAAAENALKKARNS